MLQIYNLHFAVIHKFCETNYADTHCNEIFVALPLCPVETL